jgi:hypothetical protein
MCNVGEQRTQGYDHLNAMFCRNIDDGPRERLPFRVRLCPDEHEHVPI